MMVVILLVAEDIWEKQHFNNFCNFSHPWGIVGLLLVLLGLSLRSWAAGIIHKSEQLCTIGPYSIVRHPLYLGSFLIALGFCTITADVENFIAVTLIIGLIYGPKIFYEEKKLSRLFSSDWERYKKSVDCIFPVHLPNARQIRDHFSWNMWKINKEYNAVITAALALVALHLMHTHLGM